MTERAMLDPRVKMLWWVGALAPAAVLGLAALIADLVLPTPFGLVFGPVVALSFGWALWFPAARYRAWSYQLRPHDLVLWFGVLTRVQRMVPRTRIQHVDLIGGPVERALGLRHLSIFTAGTREADVSIPGLRADEAQRLRDELLSWAREMSRPTAEPEASDRPEPGEEPEPAEGHDMAADAPETGTDPGPGLGEW